MIQIPSTTTWSSPSPICRLIDIDEDGIALEACCSNYDMGHCTKRVTILAHYCRNAKKVKANLAVEAGNSNLPQQLDGSLSRPQKWLRITVEKVDQFVFGGLVNKILHNIENHPVSGGCNDEKIIIWDNLGAHKTPYICQQHHWRKRISLYFVVGRPSFILS